MPEQTEAQLPKQPMTDEEKKDLEERSKAFNAELIGLLGKYKLGLTSRPLITPDGRIGSAPLIIDDSKSTKAESPADAPVDGGIESSEK